MHEFPTPHQDAIKSIAWGPNNAFIMTCGRGLDTCIYLHSPSGKLLQKLDTKQITNHMATISHDGKWLAAGTRLSDCKLWELKYDGSTGTFDKAVYTMNLRGHRRGMNSISFGPPSTNMVATASADGTWKVWSIDVRYKSSEDAKIIVDKQTEFKEVDLICLNPKVPAYNEVSIVGVASETTLQFCNAATGEVLQSIDTAHRDFINHITFTPEGDYMVTCGGDKNVKFWKCPPFPAKEE